MAAAGSSFSFTPGNELGSPWHDAVRDYYRDVDARRTRLLRFGGGICVNEWLSDHGAKRIDSARSRGGCGRSPWRRT